MTVQSAHMITTDYITLSQPLTDGILLHDRTERKLKLIHSLGELQPMHTYTTEYGNVLERPAKHKCVLAGSVELEVTSDEADFERSMGRLALSAGGTSSAGGAGPSFPSTSMRMATYSAVRDRWTVPTSDQPHSSCNGSGDRACVGSSGGISDGVSGGISGGVGGAERAEANRGEAPIAADVADLVDAAGRLQEREALARITALVDRVREMEEWFAGVKAEAERERRMREQTAARLGLMAERVELLHGQLTATQRENKMLRRRVADLCAAHEEDAPDSDDGRSGGRGYTPSVSGVSTRSGASIRLDGFGSGSAAAAAAGKRGPVPLANYRGPLQR